MSFSVKRNLVKHASTFKILSLPPTASTILGIKFPVLLSFTAFSSTSTTSLPGVFKLNLIITNLNT